MSGERGGERGRGGVLAPHLALVAVQCMFATWPVVAKGWVLPVLPPSVLALLRVAGATAILLAIGRIRGMAPIEGRGDIARLALYAVLGVAANQLLFVEGLARTTAVNAQVIGTSIPVFTLMFGALLGLDRITPRKLLGIALAAGGAVYLVGPERVLASWGGPDGGATMALGNAMIVVNALGYALYLVLSKPLIQKYGTITVIVWVFGIGALLITPFGVASYVSNGVAAEPTWRVWAAVAYIILFPTVGSYVLNAWALGRSRPSVVAVYVYLQPLLTGALAAVLLAEPLDPRAIPAAAMIFTGVALTTIARRNPEVEDTLSGR